MLRFSMCGRGGACATAGPRRPRQPCSLRGKNSTKNPRIKPDLNALLDRPPPPLCPQRTAGSDAAILGVASAQETGAPLASDRHMGPPGKPSKSIVRAKMYCSANRERRIRTQAANAHTAACVAGLRDAGAAASQPGVAAAPRVPILLGEFAVHDNARCSVLLLLLHRLLLPPMLLLRK